MPLRFLALGAITFYQRHLSPRKGFACAYRLHAGRQSCSALGYRAIRRRGLWHGLGLLRARLARCRAAHQQHQQRHRGHPWPPRGQAGFCDVPCELPCDLDAPACGDCVLDFPCGCADWGRSAKGERQDSARRR